MGFERVAIERDGDVAILRLADPDNHNGLGPTMLRELKEALTEFSQPGYARALLFTGNGAMFCAGAALDEIDELRRSVRLGTHHHPILRLLRDMPYPTVTAINGAAAGAGLLFALMGDIVVAAESAVLAPAFGNLGLSAECGSTFLLPRLVGWARAKEILLLCPKITAHEALDMGLISRVYPDPALETEALAFARRLAEGPTCALGLTRQLAWQGLNSEYETMLDREERWQHQVGETQDHQEAVRAFLEKRKPEFHGW